MIRSMKRTSIPERRKFDGAFRREVVLNWRHGSKSAQVVGEGLGITAKLRYAWRGLVSTVAGGEGDGGSPPALLTPPRTHSDPLLGFPFHPARLRPSVRFHRAHGGSARW